MRDHAEPDLRSYFEFCEQLWADWLAQLTNLKVGPFVRQEFDVDAAVEPYVRYRDGARPLVALLTNPGSKMAHQERGPIEVGEGPIKRGCSYSTVALELGKYYLAVLKGAARRRNESLLDLSSGLRYDGYLAVESCPFHSAKLRKKRKLLAAYESDCLLQEYRARLQEFLQPRPVVIVSAVSSRGSLSRESALSGWLAWQAKLVGIDLGRAEFLPLLSKGDRTTCAALIDCADGVPKVLIRMMGGNHLPSEENLEPLVQRLHSRG